MKILVTGAKGFVGKNLCAALENLKNGKDLTRPLLKIEEVMEYDTDTSPALLEEASTVCDFVFHLAGVNRSKAPDDFVRGNIGSLRSLLDALKKHHNACPVMLSSSIQAACVGSHDNPYGRSKRASEELLFSHGKETGATVLVYRFPNLFGKWCKPNYNSAVATFCHNTANDLPIAVHDRATRLELLHIDDLVAELLDALEGHEHRCNFQGIDALPHENGSFCFVPVTHQVTLGEIEDLLAAFKAQPETLVMPEIPENSFAKKLYATYLSYLPKEKLAFPLKTNLDERGSFTELLKTEGCGQISVNVIKPRMTKGEHWHHTKWELFIVVSGHGEICQRKLGTDEVLRHEVSGDRPEAVHILPGYTHSIINLSETENLVTLMWASEPFDPAHPDTFFEVVE